MMTLRECLQNISQLSTGEKPSVKDYKLYREKLVLRAAQGKNSVSFLGKLSQDVVKAFESDGLVVIQHKGFCTFTIVSWEKE